MMVNELICKPDGAQELVEREITDNSFAVTAESQIEALKAQLSATDYKAIKYAEGWISEADYAETKAERQAIRDQINALEG